MKNENENIIGRKVTVAIGKPMVGHKKYTVIEKSPTDWAYLVRDDKTGAVQIIKAADIISIDDADGFVNG